MKITIKVLFFLKNNKISMLVENYTQQRKAKDMWAFILFTISTTSTLFFSYNGGYNGVILYIFEILSSQLNYAMIFLAFFAYIGVYLCALAIFYLFTAPIMHIAYFVHPIILLILAILSSNPLILLTSVASFGLSLLFYFLYVKKNIKYSAPIAQLSMKIIFKQAGLILPVLFLLTGLINFILLNFILTFKYDDNLIGYFLIFNLFWSTGFVMYFVYVLISSVVIFNMKATHGYYFAALKNTLYSVGSLALASLVVALIRTLQALLSKRDKKEKKSTFDDIVEFILGLIGDLVEYLNSWAFIYISFMGLSYTSACKKRFNELLKNPKITILNNSILMTALGCIDIGDLLRFLFFGYKSLEMIIGILFGLIFCGYVCMGLDSANKTLIVIYAEDKSTFKRAYKYESTIFDNQMANK